MQGGARAGYGEGGDRGSTLDFLIQTHHRLGDHRQKVRRLQRVLQQRDNRLEFPQQRLGNKDQQEIRRLRERELGFNVLGDGGGGGER